MEDADASTWAPQSPDLSAYHSNSNNSNNSNSTNSNAEPHFVHPAQQHTPFRASAYIPGQTPFTPPSSSPIVYSKAAPMPRGKRAAPAAQDPDYLPDAGDASDKAMGKMAEGSNGGATDAVDTSGIVIKNHFPVARIKRIMQADDDVGKVAQVTPVVVCMWSPLSLFYLVSLAASIRYSIIFSCCQDLLLTQSSQPRPSNFS